MVIISLYSSRAQLLPLALSLECLGENKASIRLRLTNNSCPTQWPIYLLLHQEPSILLARASLTTPLGRLHSRAWKDDFKGVLVSVMAVREERPSCLGKGTLGCRSRLVVRGNPGCLPGSPQRAVPATARLPSPRRCAGPMV